MKYNRETTAFWIFLPLAAGALSGYLSRTGIVNYGISTVRPSFSPPAILFPIVWTLLYLLMGIGASTVYRQPLSRERANALNLFIIQLVINFFWSLIFFNAQAYGLALLWLFLLLVVVILMFLSFLRVYEYAGLLQIPYVLWLFFASYLNYDAWQLNG